MCGHGQCGGYGCAPVAVEVEHNPGHVHVPDVASPPPAASRIGEPESPVAEGRPADHGRAGNRVSENLAVDEHEHFFTGDRRHDAVPRAPREADGGAAGLHHVGGSEIVKLRPEIELPRAIQRIFLLASEVALSVPLKPWMAASAAPPLPRDRSQRESANQRSDFPTVMRFCWMGRSGKKARLTVKALMSKPSSSGVKDVS